MQAMYVQTQTSVVWKHDERNQPEREKMPKPTGLYASSNMMLKRVNRSRQLPPFIEYTCLY